LFELFDRVCQFSLQRVDIPDLVIAWFAFVAEDSSIELIRVLSQSLFACNRAAFCGRDDFLADSINFSVEIGDPFAKRVALLRRS
jgi:hypothetical protein